MSPGVLRKQAYLIWAEKTITPATLWASLPLSFSLLSFLFLPKVIPEIERKRLSQITSSSLNFRDDSCFCCPKKHYMKSFLLSHIIYELIAAIKLIQEHAKTGKARREEQHITRTCVGYRGIHSSSKIVKHAAHRVSDSEPLRRVPQSWQQLVRTRPFQ